MNTKYTAKGILASAKSIALLCILFFRIHASPAYAEDHNIYLSCSDISVATINKASLYSDGPNGIEDYEEMYYILYHIGDRAYKKFHADFNAHKDFYLRVYVEDHLILAGGPSHVDIPYVNKVGDSTFFRTTNEAMNYIRNICPDKEVHIK